MRAYVYSGFIDIVSQHAVERAHTVTVSLCGIRLLSSFTRERNKQTQCFDTTLDNSQSNHLSTVR